MSGYRLVLVAADLAAGRRAILQRAVAPARTFGAKLTLLHVVDEREAGGELQMPLEGALTESGSAPHPAAGPVVRNIEYGGRRLERSAHAFLDELVRGTGVPEVATEVVASAAVARAIVERAEEHRVDLIVLGSHSRVGLDWLFRSTADSVLRQAPCDVLAVHD